MEINNCFPAVYQRQECVHRLIKTIGRRICFHRLCVFSPFLWQKLQLLLMTGNLKVPLLNSHRCHDV